jgi:hypothetical protein
MEDARMAFASTMGKKDISPATAISKRIAIAILEERTVQE